MSEIKPYPEIILRLNGVAGFVQAVYDAAPAYDTQLEAYESVERMHERYFGRRRYEDYTNFMTARSQYWKRYRRKNKQR